MAKGATTAHQMTAGPDDRRPAFSPDGKVIAFIRRTPTTSGSATAISASSAPPRRCTRAPASRTRPSTSTGRPGRPTGARSSSSRTDPKDPNQTELGEYTIGEAVLLEPGRLAVAGPDHRQDARDEGGRGRALRGLLAGRDAGRDRRELGRTNLSLFRIFTAGWSNGQLGTPKGVTPSIRACEVAWRSDSGELAVTAADNCRRARARSCALARL